ncbi:hypothetical protein NVP1063O_154 [Vibrio phage 1.063.O._10N.261.45.C7]|nr:hypothetical protein NVP1063O_154 [Vibrio phage 1.063.O._10N.261.45.C7]
MCDVFGEVYIMSNIYNYTTIKRLKPEVEEKLTNSYLIDSTYRNKIKRDVDLFTYLKGEFGYNHLHHIRSEKDKLHWDGKVTVRGLSGHTHMEILSSIHFNRSSELINLFLDIKRTLPIVDIDIQSTEDLILKDVFKVEIRIPKQLSHEWHQSFYDKLKTF